MGILIKSFSTQPSLVALARAALSKVFNPSNYYSKSEVDVRVNARQPDVHLTATDKNTLMYNNAGNQVTQERDVYKTTRSPTMVPSLADIAARWATGQLLSIQTTQHRALTPSLKVVAILLAVNAAMSAGSRAELAVSGLSRMVISAKLQEKTPSLWALLS